MADDKRDEAAIIPLSRYRAQLSRGRTRKRADEILDHPDPAQLVPTLSVQDLYYAISEVGLASALDLLALATPAQVRGFIDLDAWERDHFLEDKAAPWLDALLDLGPAALLKAVAGLDTEVVALFIQRQARVYDLEQEAPPEQPEGHYYPTPDTFYILDVLGASEDGKRLERFIDWLYRADLHFARRAVMAAKWELPSDLEEHAYRWRAGRMSDLGYVDYYEALEIYRYLDPGAVKPDEHSAEVAGVGASLPAELLAQVGEASFLGRTLARIGDAAELERLGGALLLVMNRVLSADRIDAADLAGAREAMRRTAAGIGLGLELLGRGDPQRAADIAGEVALARIFRVGFSLTLKLQRAAEALVRDAWVSLTPGSATLLPPAMAELVAAVRRSRPMRPVPDADGAIHEGGAVEPFTTLAEVAAAARTLEEAAHLGETVRRGLGVDPRLLTAEARAGVRPPLDAIRFTTIVATLIGNRLLDRPALLVPLSPADVTQLVERALEGGALRPVARQLATQALAGRLAEREFPEPPGWAGWVDGWLAHLEEALQLAAQHPEAANLLVRA